MSSTSAENQLKVFGMQNLLVEADLEALEDRGIDIGHKATVRGSEPVDLDLFDHDIRVRARKMADFYAIYYSLENSIRRLISERLREKHGANWWDERVPQGVRDNVKKLQEKERDSVMSLRSDDPLEYTNFGELIDIFNSNWADFDDTIRSRRAMATTLSQFNQLRNVIAHSSYLHDDEILRLKLVVNDWLRLQT